MDPEFGTGTGGRRGTTSPYRLRGGNIFLPARIGRTSYWALLDTGSTRTVVSSRLARRFPLVRRQMAGAIYREVEARVVRIPRIEVLGRRVADDEAIARGPGADRVLSWQLLLGTNTLLDRRLTLDFRRRRVEVDRSDALGRSPEQVPLRCPRGRPFVRARFGERPIVALVDTGSPLCQLNPRFRGIVARTMRRERITDGTGASRREPVLRGPSLRLGPWDLGRPEFTYEPMEIIERKLRSRVDFVLGADVLRAAGGAWTFDRRRHRLSRSE
jgi:hypothetical protein